MVQALRKQPEKEKLVTIHNMKNNNLTINTTATKIHIAIDNLTLNSLVDMDKK